MNFISLEELNRRCFPSDPVPMHKLWRWCRLKYLPAKKFGRDWRVDIDAFSSEATKTPAAATDVIQLAIEMLRNNG